MVSSTTEGMPVEKLYTAEQAAELLHLTLRTVREYIKAGKLRAAKVGKQYIIKESAIDEFVTAQEYKPEG